MMADDWQIFWNSNNSVVSFLFSVVVVVVVVVFSRCVYYFTWKMSLSFLFHALDSRIA